MLADEELLTHVILPAPGNVKNGHYEVRYKQSHDWPLAFTTVVLTMNGNTIASARVVLGAVAPMPWRSKAAEAGARRQAAQRADGRRGRRSGGRARRSR